MSQIRAVAGYRLDQSYDGWIVTEVTHLFDRGLLPDTVQRVTTVLAIEDTLTEAVDSLTEHASRAGLT